MYIWLIKRPENHHGHDEAFGFVVVANTEEEARGLTIRGWGDWKYDADVVTVSAIGKASKAYKEAQIILTDFRAG